MKNRVILGVILTAVVLSISIFTHVLPDKASIMPIVVPPEVFIGKNYDSCNIPLASTTGGYLGWPFAILASLDNEACGGNSAIIYERIYPIGILITVVSGGILGYFISLALDNVRRQNRRKD